jgi:hypothetical protein
MANARRGLIAAPCFVLLHILTLPPCASPRHAAVLFLADEELMATAEQLGSQSVAAAAPSKGRGGSGGSSKNRRKG